MPSAKERQVSFAGGELSPSLWGRTDLDRYPVGARTLRNFIVTPHGVAANRPGTVHIDEIDPFGTAATVRVVGAALSDAGGRLLVFRAFQILVYGTALEQTIPTPYQESELFSLKFSQLGNVITITAPNYDAYELRRSATGVWSLTAISFDVPVFVNKAASVSPTNYPVLYHINSFAGDASHPEREWTWQVTRIQRDSEGRLYETAPYTVALYQDPDNSTAAVPTSINLYPDHPQTILFYAQKGNDMSEAGNPNTAIVGDQLVANRLYRGRAGYFGFIGETTGDRLIDDGAVPDFSNPPPQSFNPFKIYNSAGALIRTEHPTCCTFFQGRRYLAATSQRPSTAWASAVDDFKNYDEIIPADDADALSLTLATERLEHIQALVSKRQIIALTSSGEWMIHGVGQSEVIAPGSIGAHRLSAHGCAASPAPLVLGDSVFYVQARGMIPRALSVDNERGTSQSIDIALMSRHLFEGYTIADWAYAEVPYSILWVARSDGKLLSCTYVPEQNMLAWAEHDIADDGLVESVTTLPDTEDIVYLIVNRDGTRTLEKLSSRIVTDIRLGVFMDRAVTYNGLNPWVGFEGTITDAFATGGDVGDDVKLLLEEDESITGTQVGAVLQFADPDGGEPVRIQLTSYVGGFYHATVLNVAVPSGLWGVPTDQFYYCKLSVSGLDHLEGRSVTILADGNIIEGKTVSAGSVAFDDYVAIVHIGIGYNSDFESLDAIQERNRQKTIKKVWLELEGARGGSIGQSLDETLSEVRTRQVSDSYLTMGLKRGDVEMLVQSKYETSGRVAFRQSQPLPVTLLGITREIEYGG